MTNMSIFILSFGIFSIYLRITREAAISITADAITVLLFFFPPEISIIRFKRIE